MADAAVGGRSFALDVRHQLRDVCGGACGPFCELAHLVGDDGESAPGLPCAGGFDGRVERQEVGLVGDFLDQIDDATNLFGAGAQAGDFLHCAARVAGQMVQVAADGVDRVAAGAGQGSRFNAFLAFFEKIVGQLGESLLRFDQRRTVRA